MDHDKKCCRAQLSREGDTGKPLLSAKAPEIGQTSPSQGKRLGEILAGYLSCHQDFLIRGLRRRGPVRGKGQLEVADENWALA